MNTEIIEKTIIDTCQIQFKDVRIRARYFIQTKDGTFKAFATVATKNDDFITLYFKTDQCIAQFSKDDILIFNVPSNFYFSYNQQVKEGFGNPHAVMGIHTLDIHSASLNLVNGVTSSIYNHRDFKDIGDPYQETIKINGFIYSLSDVCERIKELKSLYFVGDKK